MQLLTMAVQSRTILICISFLFSFKGQRATVSDRFQSSGSSYAGRNVACLSFPLGRCEHKVQLLLLKDLEELFSNDTVKKTIS